jgi:NitT/TauT family transport system permease protein
MRAVWAVPPVGALCVILAVWEALVRILAVPLYLLPPPSAIALAGFHDARTLAVSAGITAVSALIGFALSAFFGALLGVALSASLLLERAFYPYTVFLQTVPIVAIAPLLVVWFGPGLKAVCVSAFIVSVFPVIAGTLAGMKSVDPALVDLFRLYGATRRHKLVLLQLPSALPSLLTGLRVASGLAVIGTLVGEFVAGFADGSPGLGITILIAYKQLRTDLLFAAVLGSAVLGLSLFGAVNAAGHLLLRNWHPSEQNA